MFIQTIEIKERKKELKREKKEIFEIQIKNQGKEVVQINQVPIRNKSKLKYKNKLR